MTPERLKALAERVQIASDALADALIEIAEGLGATDGPTDPIRDKWASANATFGQKERG